MNNGFIIAGTNSGCGKTTITIGLMRLFARKGISVAPFKTGPDYIDPAFHSIATNSDSHNLDSYLMSQQTVNQLFSTYSHTKDMAIIEGVMGMYDGLGMNSAGSTAELARMLDLPVILVVNCKALYQSVAAIINGFVHLDKRVKVAGVILNHVYSDDQFSFLREYVEQHCQVACLGYLPPKPEIALGSRHLGLIQADEVEELVQKIDQIADLLESHCDIDRLIDITQHDNSIELQEQKESQPLAGLKLAVARDKAFSFYYKANLDLLIKDGAELVYFSPLTDTALPPDINAVYLGGGYPEVFARELSHNKAMLQSVKQAAEAGVPIYGECGGLMYLTNGIQTTDGEFFPMCGIFNGQSEMTVRLQNFGYCLVNWGDIVARAHEFHHSKLIPGEQGAINFTEEFQIEKPERPRNWKGGLSYKNVLAGYPHIHFYSNPDFYHKICDLWMKK